MTYLDKFLEQHPNFTRIEVLEHLCVRKAFHSDSMNVCDTEENCMKCWNSEFPEEPQEQPTDTPTQPQILDSGNRREFETGAVRDCCEGRGRCDLLPLDVIATWLNDDDIVSSLEAFCESGLTEFLFDTLIHYVKKWYREDETAILDLAKHFEAGAKKYGERNWQKGIPVRCYIDSAVRHYLKYLRGDQDEPHDRAFVWNIVCAIWTCKHKPDLNEYAREVQTDEHE